MDTFFICVVLIQEYNLLYSLNDNRGLLETSNAGQEFAEAVRSMKNLCELKLVLISQLDLYLHLFQLTNITVVIMSHIKQ